MMLGRIVLAKSGTGCGGCSLQACERRTLWGIEGAGKPQRRLNTPLDIPFGVCLPAGASERRIGPSRRVPGNRVPGNFVWQG